MVPADIALNHAQAFFTRVLTGRRRVLEVGCGTGQLAWRLAHLGFKVVGVDLALPRHRPSHPKLRFEREDFFNFKDDPFDAVLFTSSLHHLHPLKGAMKRARNLLTPSGLVVIDDFDLLAPDDETARWYYEARGLLTQAGAIKHSPSHGHEAHGLPAHSHGQAELEPLRRWEKEHQHLPALHSGPAMLSALKELGSLAEVTRGPYLYRGLASMLSEGARAPGIAEWLLRTEELRIADHSLKPIGLRVVCQVT